MKDDYGTHGMDRITDYIWQNVLGVSGEDEYASDGMGSGAVRVGKRILEWDDAGFASTTRLSTVAAAQRRFAFLVDAYCQSDEEDSTEATEGATCPLHPGYHHPVGNFACEVLSDEIRGGAHND